MYGNRKIEVASGRRPGIRQIFDGFVLKTDSMD